MNVENPLPDGKLLADDIDIAFRNGRLSGSETGSFLAKEEVIRDSIFRIVVRDRATIFLISHFLKSPREFSSIREEADNLSDNFKKWKREKMKSKLPWRRSEKEVVGAITLQTLVECANEQYENFAKHLGTSIQGTNVYDYYREMTDYWSKIQEVTDAALDIG